MRRPSIVASLLILTLSAAYSPLGRLRQEQDLPLSQWEPTQSWVASHLPTDLDNVGDAPADAKVLAERATYNCTDLQAAFDQRCWVELGLSGFLMDPNEGWNHTVRICGTSESAENNDGSDCCKPGEPWTTCFLRLAHGTPGQDCSQINSQFCSYQSHLDPGLPEAVKPQYQYIMKNIYAVNDFFTTYYMALGAAQSDAQTIVQALINELDPIKPATFDLLTLLTALSVGLAFLGAPSIAVGILGLSVVTRTVAQVLTISLQQAPGTAKALWPTGTQSSQSVQIANIQTELGNSTNQLAAMINNAVQLLMSDVPTFVKFCEGGEWSGSESLSLPSKVEGLDYALRTYMTSEVMAQNGWHANPVVGPYETVRDVENSVPGGNGFSCQMGNNSVCTNSVGSAYYWSQATGIVYVFSNKNLNYQVTPYQILQDTVNNNWAILEVLFDGSFNCTKEGNYGASVVNFNWDGTLDIACISQLPINVRCGAQCPIPVNDDGSCHFLDNCYTNNDS